MWSYVLREWWDDFSERGLISTLLTIRADIERGLYFTYFRATVENRCDRDASKITKVYVDPDDIQWVSTAPPSILPRTGESAVLGVASGRWDQYKEPVESTNTYRRVENIIDSKDENDDLISSLKQGYKEQTELNGNVRKIGGAVVPDELRLAVDRNDELMRWSGGLHRLSAAKLIGIDKIPAYITVWHEESSANATQFHVDGDRDS